MPLAQFYQSVFIHLHRYIKNKALYFILLNLHPKKRFQIILSSLNVLLCENYLLVIIFLNMTLITPRLTICQHTLFQKQFSINYPNKIYIARQMFHNSLHNRTGLHNRQFTRNLDNTRLCYVEGNTATQLWVRSPSCSISSASSNRWSLIWSCNKLNWI